MKSIPDHTVTETIRALQTLIEATKGNTTPKVQNSQQIGRRIIKKLKLCQ